MVILMVLPVIVNTPCVTCQQFEMGVDVIVGVSVIVRVMVTVGEIVPLGIVVGVRVLVGVGGVPVGVRVMVGVIVTVGVIVRVGVFVRVGVGVFVGVSVASGGMEILTNIVRLLTARMGSGGTSVLLRETNGTSFGIIGLKVPSIWTMRRSVLLELGEKVVSELPVQYVVAVVPGPPSCWIVISASTKEFRKSTF
jgi:hypothetical protein